MPAHHPTPGRPHARAIALAATLTAAVLPWSASTGCESCDFSFGQIPVQIALTPRNIHAKITLCTELDDRCEARSIDGTRQPGGIIDEDLAFMIDWQGYAVCRVPELKVRVDAEGCTAQTVARERHRPDDTDDSIEIPIALECE